MVSGRHLFVQAAAPHARSIFNPASERMSMRDSSAGLARRSRYSSGGGVRCESCAAAFSFPSRAAFRYPQSRTFAASPNAAKYPTLPSRPATLMGSTAPFAGLVPRPGGDRVSASPGPRAVCPHPASPDRFHRAESVTIVCWLVNVIRSRRWVRLLGLAPVCGLPRLGPKHHSSVPRSGFLPWVLSSFRYAGAPTRIRCRTSLWSGDR